MNKIIRLRQWSEGERQKSDREREIEFVICSIGNHSLNAFLSRVILIRDI